MTTIIPALCLILLVVLTEQQLPATHAQRSCLCQHSVPSSCSCQGGILAQCSCTRPSFQSACGCSPLGQTGQCSSTCKRMCLSSCSRVAYPPTCPYLCRNACSKTCGPQQTPVRIQIVTPPLTQQCPVRCQQSCQKICQRPTVSTQCMPTCIQSCNQRCASMPSMVKQVQVVNQPARPTLTQCVTPCMPLCSQSCLQAQQNVPSQILSQNVQPAALQCTAACMPNCEPKCVADQSVVGLTPSAMSPTLIKASEMMPSTPFPQSPAQAQCIEACMPNCDPQCIRDHLQRINYENSTPYPSLLSLPEQEAVFEQPSDFELAADPYSSGALQCVPECMPTCDPQCILEQYLLKEQEDMYQSQSATTQSPHQANSPLKVSIVMDNKDKAYSYQNSN